MHAFWLSSVHFLTIGEKIFILARWLLRASTIESSQLAIRIKIVYLCLVGGERIGERR
jgi:hypothetical protein